MNGLFPDEPKNQHTNDKGYILPRTERNIQPLDGENSNPAVELIRRKINSIYGAEPDARQEAEEAEETPKRSKHQEFMYHLSTSGKSLAEIQSAWHQYYIKLDDNEKREVWHEFYAANARTPSPHTHLIQQRSAMTRPHASAAEHVLPKGTAKEHPNLELGEPSVGQIVVNEIAAPAQPKEDRRSKEAIHKQIIKRVRSNSAAQIKAKQHLQSLAFGLGLGAIVIVVFLFSFFNEVIIAPFIQPGANAEATPIILSQSSIAPSSTPQVIIPKINVQIPTIYGVSTNEDDIEDNLEDGVVHYSSTSVPGQAGNAAFFGHSSNNIFNPGKYKFAFVLLHTLVPGDIFYLTYNGKVYTYKVFQKEIVEPTDTWVLNPVQGHPDTATLITCDPPGTSLHRLVVWGDQIDPSPTTNTSAPVQAQVASAPKQLADNGPSLWDRLWQWTKHL